MNTAIEPPKSTKMRAFEAVPGIICPRSGMKFNVYEFALMEGLIKLGRSYGLKPWQLNIEYDRSTGETYFTGAPAGEVGVGERHDAMRRALGLADDQRVVPYEEGAEMMEAIEKAVHNAPRKWVR